MKHAINKNTLKGVSTLDIIKKSFKYLTFLLILTAFSPNIFGGHSTLDIIDPTFNPNIVANLYDNKRVLQLATLPDGKILALGNFNSYNRVPTGKLVRLNADGSLDTTFNNQTITSVGLCDLKTAIIIQPDGKIVLSCREMVANGQSPKYVLRLNADGTLDTSFNYTLGIQVNDMVMDSLGRLHIQGSFSTPQGDRPVVRLNPDGSYDNTFNFAANIGAIFMATQGSRLILGNNRIIRLNENGSEDTTFALSNTIGGSVNHLITQPDNKIVYVSDTVLSRVNENGGTDTGFQTTTLSITGQMTMRRAPDGKIVVTRLSGNAIFRRYLPDGGEDPSFTPYTHPAFSYAFTIQPDGGVITGDYWSQTIPHGINNFRRLIDGVPDPAFNPDGIAFQNILPGSIRSIEPLADGKIFLGGKFDVINNISRPKIVRLNADASVDTSFQLNTSGTGNYFSLIHDVYQIRAQADGKVVVSGWFDYFLNGEEKKNLIRLNTDGSIDDTFNLTQPIPDYSVINLAGRNHFVTLSGGDLVIGNSKNSFNEPTGPLKILAGGSRDMSFMPTLNSASQAVYIDDVALQPDGKILFSGSHNLDFKGHKTFVARLNPDGSTDTTFAYSEETGRLRPVICLLPNGKILVGKHDNGSSLGTVARLNADGTPDNTFNLLSIPNGIINAVLSLPNGKIFVGGRFTVTVNGQPTQNLLRLDADGNIEPTVYNVNNEVLSLAVDNEGRVLVGGSFTVIDTNGGNGEGRTYAARLTDAPRFDFDGDGRSDLGTFTDANGVWNILHSGSNQPAVFSFGLSGDKTAPADYDGDGKADYAVFRPSDGVWYLWKSRGGFTAIQWGLAEDKPVAADYDGDGLADVAVWRPSNRVWYIRQSSNGQMFAVQFGLSDDIPLTDADFDGDGKADIAVWRPSTGVFYWLVSGSNNEFRAVQFGLSGDIPVVGDFNGDGKTDLVVFRPTDGNWYQYLTAPNGNYAFAVFNFGLSGDEPVAADYDGDGKTDIAVRRQNIWHIQRSGQGYTSSAFADANDQAVASSLNR